MSVQSQPAAQSGSRLVSLDVLRGFDMCWILGADAVVLALGKLSDAHWVHALTEQMDHKIWSGFAFYDLIFPTFVFISGVALVFSLPKSIERHGRGRTVRHILARAAILFAFGILYNGGLGEPWPEVRLVGVLQRIAIAYAATGILFCYCRPRTCYVVGVALLLGYWALLALVPVRNVTLTPDGLSAALGTSTPTAAQVRQLFDGTTEYVTGSFERGRNLANHFDYQWLPGGMYRKYWDPEGILSTFPAIATCLLGLLAGQQLRREDRTPSQKVAWLAAAGLGCLAVGWTWHLVFPVVKDLWSSSFVLVAGGYSLLLLAFFYYVIDVRQWRGWWCEPFRWIGLNPITLYLATSLVGFHDIARRLCGGSVAGWLDGVAPGLSNVGVAVVALGLVIALAGFLHRRGIYLRV